nr:hypothetical protein BaRGS_032495 [Batillaria attramentaria]
MSCRIAHAGQLSESFEVKTGVRQGCLLSPFLFLLVIDWIMKTTTAGRKNGIQEIRNEELWERAGQEPVAKQILRRKWGWIGHTLRKPASSTTRQALTWNPAGEKEERPASQQLEAGH